MSDTNFICPTCKRPTHPDDNEIIEYLAKEIDRYTDVLAERTKELDRVHKELEQSEICCTEWEKQALDYKAENIGLSGDLERTRKALDVAVEALKDYEDRDSYDYKGNWCGCEYSTAHHALEQITALEQKDK